MSIRHSLIRSATPRFREKFTCTFVGTGRNVRYAFFHILPVLQPWWDFCRELLLRNHVWNLQWDQMPATKATEEWWEWKEGQQVVLAGHRDHGLAWWWHFAVVGGGRGGARPGQFPRAGVVKASGAEA